MVIRAVVLTRTMLSNLGIRFLSAKLTGQTAQASTAAIKPIIDKYELDNIRPDDPKHYQKVDNLDGYASNVITYDPRIHYFIKKLMKGGNSWLARRIVDRALYQVKLKQVEKFNKENDDKKRAEIPIDPQKIFIGAVENCKPLLKLTPVKKGGITYQVPVPMSDKERNFKAVKMLIATCEEKERNVRIWNRLAIELIEAYQNQGRTIKKKVEIHKQAEQNRAYAQYRWR